MATKSRPAAPCSTSFVRVKVVFRHLAGARDLVSRHLDLGLAAGGRAGPVPD